MDDFGGGMDQLPPPATTPLKDALSLTLPPLEELELAPLASPVAKAAAKNKRRKMMYDEVIMLSGNVYRDMLKEGGTDDITRSPYIKGRKRLSHEMPAASFRRKVIIDEELAILFCRPSTSGWGEKPLALLRAPGKWIETSAQPASADVSFAQTNESEAAQRSFEYAPFEDAGLEFHPDELAHMVCLEHVLIARIIHSRHFIERFGGKQASRGCL